MSEITVKHGQNLWNIVKSNYSLTSNSDISKKVNEIAKANNIKNPNSIFAGQKISLSASENTQAPTTQETTTKATEPAKQPTETQKTSTLNDWMNECADSMVNIDEKGNPVFDKEVKPFDMAGDEFRNDITKNGGENAAEIYKQKSLETAKKEIATYDTDKDGTISPYEQVMEDSAEFKKKYPNAKYTDEMQNMSLKAFHMLDINNDKKIDSKEYSAFLYAMDSNNKNETANGQITREEYLKTTDYFTGPINSEYAKFRGKIKSCYNGLYGNEAVK